MGQTTAQSQALIKLFQLHMRIPGRRFNLLSGAKTAPLLQRSGADSVALDQCSGGADTEPAAIQQREEGHSWSSRLGGDDGPWRPAVAPA